jgi:hypothetical protein
MGHIFGSISDIILDNPSDADGFDFFLDESRTWVRRRLSIDAATQLQHRLLNVSFWLDNPKFYDPRHKSGILSAVYLALNVPSLGRLLLSEGIRRAHVGPGGQQFDHMLNVLAHPLETATAAMRILRQRYFEKPRRPGFLVRNRSGRYALTFHAEQLPRKDSRATLNGDGDLEVDLRFSEVDAVSVVDSHRLLDESLRASAKGRLEYSVPEKERVAAVLRQASDGFHQEGLLRMGPDPNASVVDAQCKVHGFKNLFIASSGVFPTSGQANPTFSACALAIRLAHHLAEKGEVLAAR